MYELSICIVEEEDGEGHGGQSPQYENMQVSAIVQPHPNEKEADSSSSETSM